MKKALSITRAYLFQRNRLQSNAVKDVIEQPCCRCAGHCSPLASVCAEEEGTLQAVIMLGYSHTSVSSKSKQTVCIRMTSTIASRKLRLKPISLIQGL